MAKVTFKSDVTWTGEGVKSVARVKQHELIIDESSALGGKSEGPNPVEFILASLGGCINVLLVSLASHYDVELEAVATRVEGDLDSDGYMELAPVRPGFQEIRYIIEVKSPSPRDRIEALAAHAQRICPVKDTLTGVPMVQIQAA